MSAGDWVAIYAAMVASASLGWQTVWHIKRQRRAEEPGITVRLANAPHDRPIARRTIRVIAVNRGERPVGIRVAELELQDGSGRRVPGGRGKGTASPKGFTVSPSGPRDTIPGTVAPWHSIEAFFSFAFLERNGIDLERPLVGLVNLANGHVVRSIPTTLRE